MYGPILNENGRTLTLAELSYEQCERLHSILSDKMDKAISCGASGTDQLQMMIDMVLERIDMYDSGMIKRVEIKKQPFKNLRIDD
jgi:hypothetical protein